MCGARATVRGSAKRDPPSDRSASPDPGNPNTEGGHSTASGRLPAPHVHHVPVSCPAARSLPARGWAEQRGPCLPGAEATRGATCRGAGASWEGRLRQPLAPDTARVAGEGPGARSSPARPPRGLCSGAVSETVSSWSCSVATGSHAVKRRRRAFLWPSGWPAAWRGQPGFLPPSHRRASGCQAGTPSAGTTHARPLSRRPCCRGHATPLPLPV